MLDGCYRAVYTRLETECKANTLLRSLRNQVRAPNIPS